MSVVAFLVLTFVWLLTASVLCLAQITLNRRIEDAALDNAATRAELAALKQRIDGWNRHG